MAASPKPVPPSDRVRFGIIGIGMQGSGLLGTAITLPGVECVAACDLYDGRQTLAKEIVKPDLPTTRRYQDLLDNKELDCIIAAVPDHWHKQIVVDTVSAGKDIYCEKPMSHNAAEGFDMAAAQKKTGRIVQIGSQRVSSVVYAKARDMIAKGAIGDVNLVEGTLGRNDPTGCWEYPPPPIFLRKRSTGTRGRVPCPNGPSILSSTRAGAAGKSTARASLATCWSSCEWHSLRARSERASETGDGHGRNSALEGWPQHARCARVVVRVRQPAGLHAPQPRRRKPGGRAIPGFEGYPRSRGVFDDVFPRKPDWIQPQLLRVRFPESDARRVFQAVACRA